MGCYRLQSVDHYVAHHAMEQTFNFYDACLYGHLRQFEPPLAEAAEAQEGPVGSLVLASIGIG